MKNGSSWCDRPQWWRRARVGTMMKRINVIKRTLKPLIPKPIWELAKIPYYALRIFKYRIWGRPVSEGETSKAKQRRIREAFFARYCNGKGFDIGYGGDLLTEDCIGWDIENGDAQYLKGVNHSRFDFVYSSHTLEHMVNPDIALKHWWCVLKSGGYLILYVPHRDLYEKKKTLPSRWNADHKHFFLLDKDEKPDTIGIIPLVQRALSGFEIVYAKECSEGHTITDPELHSDGEYSIEVVVQKKLTKGA